MTHGAFLCISFDLSNFNFLTFTFISFNFFLNVLKTEVLNPFSDRKKSQNYLQSCATAGSSVSVTNSFVFFFLPRRPSGREP